MASRFFYWGLALIFMGVCMIPTGFLISNTTIRVAGALNIITGVVIMVVAACFINAKENKN